MSGKDELRPEDMEAITEMGPEIQKLLGLSDEDMEGVRRNVRDKVSMMVEEEADVKRSMLLIGQTLGVALAAASIPVTIYVSRIKVALRPGVPPMIRAVAAGSLLHSVGQLGHQYGKSAGQKLHETDQETSDRMDKLPPITAWTLVSTGLSAVYSGVLSGYKHDSVARGIGQAALSVALSGGVQYVMRIGLHDWMRAKTKEIDAMNKKISRRS